MNIVIVGGVAAGATAAARLRRLSEKAQITIIEKGPYISFANCGLPYFISGDIDRRSKLLLNTPEGFHARYNVNVILNTEVTEIDRKNKKLKIIGKDKKSSQINYDKLILCQGGIPFVPDIPGSNEKHVFKLWTIPDMDSINNYIIENKPRTACVIGGGFIGLEMAEAFHARGLKTTVVELADSVMSIMDNEFGEMIKRQLNVHGIDVYTKTSVSKIIKDSNQVLLSNQETIDADLVLFSVGVRPVVLLAKQSGIELGQTGAVHVDEYLKTSDDDIYACGDMVEVVNKISGKTVRLPLAGPANRQGRIVAQNVLGKKEKYNGVIATSVVKILDHTAGITGLSEKSVRDLGIDYDVCTIHKAHHASYYPGSQNITLKLIYEKKGKGRILGAQAFGRAGVDKRIDAVAACLQGKLTLDDLSEVDFAYAPPYSSAHDPLNIAAFVGQNNISGFSPTVSVQTFSKKYNESTDIILDVRNLGEYSKGHIKNALNIPVDDLRFSLDKISKDKNIYVHCAVGYRAHLAVRILKEHNFKNVWNITGGFSSLQLDPNIEISVL